MSSQGTIRRYTLIIEKINSKQYPSFEEIKDYLFDHGFEISPRTLQRAIEQIRCEFGIEITYNRYQNGYYIDLEASVNIESFFRFLEIVNTAELLTESLSESKDSLKYISFDNVGNLRGTENLKPLLSAIKSRRKVSFVHHNFHTQKFREFALKPYLLREYQNRWYVIGQIGNYKEFRSFGIDRISKLQILSETYTPDKKVDPSELFENTIGMVYSQEAQQRVVLSFTLTQGQYIKSLPFHKSQKVLIDNEEECRIELNVVPNYELTHLILMQGDAVKVLEPKWLAREVVEILKSTLKNYK
ncbi:MAG: WYL domain-containing protein [Bacteroidota bacterium]